MSLTPQTIVSNEGARRSSKRLGRGNSSQKGTYSGRGMKGQRARSGGKGGGKVRGIKQMILKIPKLRGFKSIAPKAETVTLAMLSRGTKAGETVTPYTLEKAGIVRSASNGVKIVMSGSIDHSVIVQGCDASSSAIAAIEKAGGSFVR